MIRCPDDGTCHHDCKPGDCFRVRTCEPLSPFRSWGDVAIHLRDAESKDGGENQMSDDKPNIHGAKDLLAELAYGKTITQAHEEMVCVSCKTSIDELMQREGWSALDQREYRLSGLCPSCFADLTHQFDGEDQ